MIVLSGFSQPGLISVSHDTVCSAQVIDASFTNCSHQQHSLSFNNSYVQIANSTKYNFGVNQNFTIELWVNSTFIDVTAVPSHGQWLFGKSGNSWNPHYHVGIQRNSGLPRISISDGSNVVQFNGTMNVCDGQWHHVAYVFNRTNNSIQIIIDGVLNATGSITIVGNTQNSAPVVFGDIYYGLIDDIRVWNTARTVVQVNGLMNQLINPANHPDLIGHYDFNEGTGNLIYDCAPNPENGMFVQPPTWSSQSALPGNLTFPLTWSNGSTSDSTQFLLTSDTTIWAHSGFCKYVCTDTVNLYVLNDPIDFLPDTVPTCSGTDVWLTPSIPLPQITWFNGSNDDSVLVNASGLYWASTIQDECTFYDTVYVYAWNDSLDFLPDTVSMCPGTDAWLTPSVPLPQITWFNGSNDSVLVNASGLYWASTIQDECTFYDTVYVSDCDIILHVPNVFTPNGDGTNDYFRIENLDKFPNTEVYVFNRWGRTVFTSRNYGLECVSNGDPGCWNGQVNNSGGQCPEGTYYYIIRLPGDDERKGSLNLFRN